MTNEFKNECKNPAYKNRLGNVRVGDLTISNSTTLNSFEITDSCLTNDTIIGSTNNKTIKITTVEDYDLADKEASVETGIKYDDESTEFIQLGTYIITKEETQDTSSSGSYSGSDYMSKLDVVYKCTISEENLTTAKIKDFYIDACNQAGLTPKTTSITNGEIIVGGNPFTNNETIRTVISNVAQAGCYWAEIDEEEQKIDLKWFDNEISETFTKNDYSELEKNQVFGPVNCVVIEEANVDGENVTAQDEESIEENGETQILISGNYFLYTEELRLQGIEAIWQKLNGFTYVNAKLISYTGKPYLKKGNKIKIQAMDETYFDTYIISHTFTYDGTYQSVIESPSLTKSQQSLKNTVEKSISKTFRNVQLTVNKVEGQISSAVEKSETAYEEVKKMEVITEEAYGNTPLIIEDGGNYNLLTNIIRGYSEQEEGATPTNPKEVKNIYKRENNTNYIVEKINGKNIFFGNLEIGNISSTTGENVESNQYVRSVEYLEVEPNITYTASNNLKKNIALRFYKKDKTFLSSGLTGSSPNTFITPDECYYMRIVLTSQTDTDVLVQIERGAKETEYDSYKENSIKVDIGNNELCRFNNVIYKIEEGITYDKDVFDEANLIDGFITKRIGKITLNGNENIKSRTGKDGSTLFCIQLENCIGYSNSHISPILCNKLEPSSRDNLYNKTEDGICYGHLTLPDAYYQLVIRASYLDGKSVSQFKTWLSENNLEVYYIYENEEKITIKEEKIKLFNEYNKITIPNDYDLNTYIDIVYYNNSPLNENYALKEETTKEIEEKISASEGNTDIKINNLSDDVDKKLENYATTDYVTTTVNTKVEEVITDENLVINVAKKVEENGITKVDTKTGFTFDVNGMTIDKDGSDTKTLIDEDGMTVYSKTGSEETEVQRVDSTGVYSENVNVRTFLIVGEHTRFQDYEDGTGCFYI